MSTSYSDFYFVEKAVTEVWIWMWFIHRVWSTDKFSNLTFKTMELKLMISILVLITLPILAIYDISWIKLKYSEGVRINNNNGDYNDDDEYIQKSYSNPNNSSQIFWSKENQILKELTDYLLCVGYSLQTGTLFLLHAFWNHLADKINGRTFKNSWAFKLYIAWCLLSIMLFPFSRYLLRNNQLLLEIIPKLTFSIVLLIIFLLGIRTRIRLKKLIKSFHQQSLESLETSLHVNYFLEMNHLLMIGLLLTSTGFLFLSVEELAMATTITNIVDYTQMHIINVIIRDFLSVLTNLGNLILWVTIIHIIYPRYHITGLYGSLSLTKKTLNILSKVFDIDDNNFSKTTTTTIRSNGSRNYVKEDDLGNENNNECVNEDGIQRFSKTVVNMTNNNDNNNDNKNDNIDDIIVKIHGSIDNIIKEQEEYFEKVKNSSDLIITSPTSPLSISSLHQMTTTMTHLPKPLPPSLSLLQYTSSSSSSSSLSPSSSPSSSSSSSSSPSSSPPSLSTFINNNYSNRDNDDNDPPLPPPPMLFSYKDKSISLLERNNSPQLCTSQYNYHHQYYNHHSINNNHHHCIYYDYSNDQFNLWI